MLSALPAIYCASIGLLSIAMLLFSVRFIRRAQAASREAQTRLDAARLQVERVASERAAANARLDAVLDQNLQQRKADRTSRRLNA